MSTGDDDYSWYSTGTVFNALSTGLVAGSAWAEDTLMAELRKLGLTAEEALEHVREHLRLARAEAEPPEVAGKPVRAMDLDGRTV